jgi:circadian clock protein KaiB
MLPQEGLMKFRLFICDSNTSSQLAIRNAQSLVNSLDGSDNSLEIIDVLVNPEAAEEARILATPTLIKDDPTPVRMLVGDLSDMARVRAVLHLPSKVKEESSR